MKDVQCQCSMQFRAIFGHSGNVLCRQYVDSLFFICSLDNEFNISTVSQRDTHLGYSQGLEQSVILFHLRTLGQKSLQTRESIRVQFDYHLRTLEQFQTRCEVAPQSLNRFKNDMRFPTKLEQ